MLNFVVLYNSVTSGVAFSAFSAVHYLYYREGGANPLAGRAQNTTVEDEQHQHLS